MYFVIIILRYQSVIILRNALATPNSAKGDMIEWGSVLTEKYYKNIGDNVAMSCMPVSKHRTHFPRVYRRTGIPI